MKLSIIIPHHNELNIQNTLQCLNLQQSVDFNDIEIIIVNNCENPIDIDEFISNLLNIKKSIKYEFCFGENGPGPSKQYGINISNSPYIMFIDSGDLLYSNLSLYYVINILKTNKNFYSFGFINTNEYGIYEHNNEIALDVVWDKVYNKQFLIEHDIKFSDDIYFGDDVNFGHFLSYNLDNYEIINQILYIHLLDINSVSNSTFLNIETYKRYLIDIIKSKKEEINYINYHNKNVDIHNLILNFLPYIYWTLQQYLVKHPEDFDDADAFTCNEWKRFISIYLPNKDFGDSLNKQYTNFLNETYQEFVNRNS